MAVNSDGRGCKHTTFIKSFRTPTQRECSQCGKLEILILRQKVISEMADNVGFLRVIASLQVDIAEKGQENARLRDAAQAVVDSVALPMPGDYNYYPGDDELTNNLRKALEVE